MKIVVLDGYTLNPGDLNWKELKELGECKIFDRTSLTDTQEIIDRISDAEVVFTNKTPITKTVFEKCPNIKYIGEFATGYNNIDLAAAKERGIIVTNIPTYGTDAVGQFTIALLLEICHHIGHHNKVVHEGKWENSKDFCFWDYPLIELAGKTMGIIGYGRIGQSTGKIAEALGMNVIVYDEYKDKNLINQGCKYVDLEYLLKNSDVISLHCPLFPSTEGIINKENINKMKDGVIILNDSRGPLIIDEDLAEALNSGKVAAAGLDVVSVEPIKGDNPLLKAKNCIITPHIAWAPKEARERLLNTAVSNFKNFLAGKPTNVVNI